MAIFMWKDVDVFTYLSNSIGKRLVYLRIPLGAYTVFLIFRHTLWPNPFCGCAFESWPRCTCKKDAILCICS